MAGASPSSECGPAFCMVSHEGALGLALRGPQLSALQSAHRWFARNGSSGSASPGCLYDLDNLIEFPAVVDGLGRVAHVLSSGNGTFANNSIGSSNFTGNTSSTAILKDLDKDLGLPVNVTSKNAPASASNSSSNGTLATAGSPLFLRAGDAVVALIDTVLVFYPFPSLPPTPPPSPAPPPPTCVTTQALYPAQYRGRGSTIQYSFRASAVQYRRGSVGGCMHGQECSHSLALPALPLQVHQQHLQRGCAARDHKPATSTPCALPTCTRAIPGPRCSCATWYACPLSMAHSYIR